MDYVSTTIIIAVVTAGLVSISTIILNYLEKRKNNGSYDVIEFVGEITRIVLNTVQKTIETKNINKNDFKTKADYIDYIADNLADSIESILKGLNVYDTCQLVFRGDASDIIKTIIVNNEAVLGIDREWETK